MKKINSVLRLTIVIILLFSSGSHASSQNGHYWTQQYGTKSMLLSGSVIGGVEDLGAVYYNPARLSQIEGKLFVLSADVYEYNALKVKDPFGDKTSISQNDLSGIPNLTAGTFTIPFLKNHYFGWSIMVRGNTDLSFNYKNDVHEDVFNDIPGTEYFGAELGILSKTKEQWFGGAWAYPFNDKLSIGLSGFLSVLDIAKGTTTNLYALTEAGQTATFQDSKEIKFHHISALLKLGLSYQREKAIYGLTIKTPQLGIDGNAKFNKEYIFVGIEGVHENPYQFIATHQKELATNYRSPWSLGIGTSQQLGSRLTVYASSEYYMNVKEYTLFEAKDYISQSSNEINSFKYTDKLKSVINGGFGLEFVLSDKIRAYGSFCTDFSAVEDNPISFIGNKESATNSTLKADFYHFGGGFVLSFKKADITFGTTYTGGKQYMSRAFNFPSGNDDNLFSEEDLSTINWSRWRFVFSFSLPFLKDFEKKIEEKIGL